MAFVLDASVVAFWAFRDEDHPWATRALARLATEEAVVPSLLWFEIRNILIVSERRKRITEADSAAFLRNLAALPIRVDLEPHEEGVLKMAREHNLSVYDAAYLELAQRESIPLATLDAKLAIAARTERVRLIERDE